MKEITLKRKRMLLYFIEATQKIIDRDGFDNVTIRNISKEAGYNSATLYNYYDDLDHLLQFACIEYLVDYQKKLIKSLKSLTDAEEIYIRTWTLFASECYDHPSVFYHLFFSKHRHQIHETFYRYLELFDITYDDIPNNEIFSFINKPDLVERHKILLMNLVNGSTIPNTHIEDKSKMIVMIFESLLNRYRENSKQTKKDFTNNIISYSKILIGLQ